MRKTRFTESRTERSTHKKEKRKACPRNEEKTALCFASKREKSKYRTESANKTRYWAITNCREQQLNKMQFQFLFCIEFVVCFPFDVLFSRSLIVCIFCFVLFCFALLCFVCVFFLCHRFLLLLLSTLSLFFRLFWRVFIYLFRSFHCWAIVERAREREREKSRLLSKRRRKENAYLF